MTNLSMRSRSPTALTSHGHDVKVKSFPDDQGKDSSVEFQSASVDVQSPAPADAALQALVLVPLSKGSDRNPSHRTGRWTLDEKVLFLYGLEKFGKGRWKKMSVYLPNRSLVQIKSHAQKVLKRMDAGENVFRRIDDNSARMELLVAEIHQKLGIEAPALHNPRTMLHQHQHLFIQQQQQKTLRPKQQLLQSPPPPEAPPQDGAEHIIAALALSQLGAPSAAR